jgi:hypothetical protein
VLSGTVDSTQWNIDVCLAMFKGGLVIFGAERHDFMVRFDVYLVEDAFA